MQAEASTGAEPCDAALPPSQAEASRVGAEPREDALGGSGGGTATLPLMHAALEEDDCIRTIMRFLPTTRARCVALFVSATWRAAGLADPDLWRQIIIPYNHGSKSLSDGQLDALLGRAGDRLEVLFVGGGSTITSAALRLLKHASGLKRLVLTSPMLSGADIIAALPPSLVALREVEIDGCQVTASQLDAIHELVQADDGVCEIDISKCSACTKVDTTHICENCYEELCYDCCGPSCEVCYETRCGPCAEDDDDYDCCLCSQCERYICGSCDEEEATAAREAAGLCGNSKVCVNCASGMWRECCPGMQGFALVAQMMASLAISQQAAAPWHDN
ncbi:hypothetical protein T492DRAFT_1136136 [Pavlovales sp. CCMP2436]|nr:hypothetical protein T492DRAFT_1136136 [Pavlovales sp. CCMP2436]